LKRDNYISVAAAIQKLLKQNKLDERISQSKVIEIWEQIVGAQIAKAAKAEKINRGVLTVRVEKSVWRNELNYLKKQIISKLNEALEKEVVKEIIFR